MMFCLTVLLSCAAMMMNTGTASAMTLADLAGDYRIVAKSANTDASGCIVSLRWENGELIGTATKVTSRSGWKTGQIFMQNVYVDNGTIYCQCTPDGPTYAEYLWDYRLKIFNNGAILKVVNVDRDYAEHELHRL